MSKLSTSDLAAALESSVPPLLLDVRLAEVFMTGHIPAALNNCVFETAFLERLPDLIPNKDVPVVIYGSSGKSAEASIAAEKLARAGYTDLVILEGGLEAWTTANKPTHSEASASPLPAPLQGRHQVDLAESRIEWLGRNLLNKHWGTIGIKSGHLDFTAGKLTSGAIELDLRNLQCTDLAGSDLHEVLIHHLLDHDFLDLESHPQAALIITAASPVQGAGPGSLNLHLTADLTLKGVTHAIEFDAASGLTPEGKAAAQAAFAIDRTKWGILYGSGRFFDHLAGHLVNDLIEFQIRIVTA